MPLGEHTPGCVFCAYVHVREPRRAWAPCPVRMGVSAWVSRSVWGGAGCTSQCPRRSMKGKGNLASCAVHTRAHTRLHSSGVPLPCHTQSPPCAGLNSFPNANWELP